MKDRKPFEIREWSTLFEGFRFDLKVTLHTTHSLILRNADFYIWRFLGAWHTCVDPDQTHRQKHYNNGQGLHGPVGMEERVLTARQEPQKGDNEFKDIQELVMSTTAVSNLVLKPNRATLQKKNRIRGPSVFKRK